METKVHTYTCCFALRNLIGRFKHAQRANIRPAQTSSGPAFFEVSAFGSILLSISETTEDNLTAVALIKAKLFIMQQRDGVIQSVKHPKSSPFALK